jgi:hypothetical protein
VAPSTTAIEQELLDTPRLPLALTPARTEQEVLDMLAACGPGAAVEELARRLAHRAQERLLIVCTITYHP